MIPMGFADNALENIGIQGKVSFKPMLQSYEAM
jgi:hypothetical protein